MTTDVVYCSRQCNGGRPTSDPGVTKACPGCGEAFTTPTWRQSVFCSKACRSESSKIETVCPQCGGGFFYYQSWPRKFCSKACQGAANRQWKTKRYYGPNWVSQRNKAIDRDRGCVDCGIGPATVRLHVHHIRSLAEFEEDYEAGNDLSNLVTLCPNCHSVRHNPPTA